MSNSILEILGVHVQAGLFDGGVDFDLFSPEGKNSETSRVSVLLGPNGSGKTTIATEIAHIAEADSGTRSYFYDSDKSRVVLSGQDSGRVRVFGEEYVREKILIEQDGLESIVMLGEQTTAKKKLDELDNQLIELGRRWVEYEVVKHNAEEGPKSLSKLEASAKKSAKDGGWAMRRALVEGRNQSLTQQRWDQIVSIRPTKSRQVLEEEFDKTLDSLRVATDVGTIIECRIPLFHDVCDEGVLVGLLGHELDEPVLTERERRILGLIQQGDQRLVELARDTFAAEETDTCPLCQQHVDPEYKVSLVESIIRVLNEQADNFKRDLEEAKLQLVSVSDQSSGDVPGALLARYNDAVLRADKLIAKYAELVEQRLEALYSPIWIEPLGLDEAIASANEAALEANQAIESINEAIRERTTLRHRLLGINDEIARIDAARQIDRLNEASAQVEEARRQLHVIEERQRQLEADKEEATATLSMTEIAASTINAYLANVYFDSERFTLVPSGSVYRLRSNGKPVLPKDISTGERNILGLCYFFSEGGKGGFEGSEDDEAQLIVLDDPISSFDMENRIGVCSLLRNRTAHILASNADSKLVVLTHDISVAAEFQHILADTKDSFRGTSSELSVSYLELRGGEMRGLKLKEGEYAALLKRAYDFAISEQEDVKESYVIGNILRRILEGYGSFNYALSMEAISRDKDLSTRFGPAGELLQNVMYRLALNDESHMRERLRALSPTICFERYSYEEKRVVARCVFVLLNSLDQHHVSKILERYRISRKELSRYISQWEVAFTPKTRNA